MIDKPGIYRDVIAADYFADPVFTPSLTQSLCKILLDQSALHGCVEHPRLTPSAEEDDEPEKYVKAQAIGNAAHKIILGRGKELAIINAKDFKGGDAKKIRDEASTAGLTPVLMKHYENAVAMIEAARLQLKRHEDKDAFTAGSGEVMIVWQEDGLWFRSLIDWLSDDLRTIDDYKSTQMSVAPHVLGHRAEAGGWHLQAAFIERGLDILNPDNAGRRRFRNIAQEGYRPYALTVMHMNEHWLTMGRKQVDAAIPRWRQAVSGAGWLGYPLKSITPEYPGFQEKKWLGRELDGDFESPNDTKLIMAG